MSDRMSTLADRLRTATLEGKVDWTSETTASFLLALPSGSVRVRSVDGDGTAPFEMVLFDENGTAIESVATQWQDQYEPATWNEPLYELYQAARTNALNIDAVIDGILRDVDAGTVGEVPTPPPPPEPKVKPKPFTGSDDDIPF